MLTGERSRAAMLCICGVLGTAGRGTAQTPHSQTFSFTAVDNALLEEVNEYDRQLTKKGLVFPDRDVQAYVEEVGRKLIAGQTAPDKVEFRFRVVRDPMVNAFAL